MIKKENVKYLYLFFALLAFVYLLIRAITVGITYDEAWTIRSFVPQNILNIITLSPCEANNHILNTLLIKFFFLFENHSVFIARLPNVLASILYLYYGYKILFQKLSPFIGLACFLLLILNPFVIEFFSIARGYGLALGFQMASFYYFLVFLNRHKSHDVLLSLVFCFLSIISVISLLNFYVVILFLIIVSLFVFKGEKNNKLSFIYSIFITTALAVFITIPIKKLVKNNCLYYGGFHNFYSDTLNSLTQYSLYSPDVNLKVNIVLAVFTFIFFAVIFVSYLFNRVLLSDKNLILAVLGLSILSVIV